MRRSASSSRGSSAGTWCSSTRWARQRWRSGGPATSSSVLADVGISFPAVVSAAPGTVLVGADGSTVTAIFNLPAVLIAVLVTALLVRGVQESARVNGVMVVVKVVVVLLVIAAGVSFVDADTLHAAGAAEHRHVRGVRLVRGDARRGGDLLRLHRLRRRLDRGPGGAEPAPRHADRHPGLAGRSARFSTSPWRW